jgi:PKD repeat protein
LSIENPTVWEWDFGDGGASTDQSPMYTYNADGTYTVTLTARSASGADAVVHANLIAVPEPAAILQLASGCLCLWGLSIRGRKSYSRRFGSAQIRPRPSSSVATAK